MTNKKKYLSLAAIVVLLILANCTTTETATSEPATQDSQSVGESTGLAKYTSGEALAHVGERATVCGTVADTNYATASNGRPTFLNFDKPFPRHEFTVVIWGSDRSRFPSSPESFYANKTVCANGLIELFRGKPQIIARNESQLVVQ